MSVAVDSPRLRLNAVANIVGRVASVVLWIAVTPFALEHLGPERFAVWALFFVLNGYVAALDFGASAGVARFVAVAVARGDRSEAQSVILRSLGLGLVIGVLWGLICIFGRGLFVHVFHVPPEWAAEVRSSLTVFGLSLMLYALSQVLLGALVGFQRLALWNLYFLIGLSVHLGLLVVALSLGHGLVGAAAAAVAGHMVVALLAARSARATLARIPEGLGAGRFSWHDLFRYGVGIQAASFFGVAQMQAGKVMLGAIGQLVWVTKFELAFRVTNALWSLSTLIQIAVIPAAAHAAEVAGEEGARRMYDWCCRWVMLVGAYVLGLVATTAPALFLLWLGRPHPEVASVARWIAVGFGLSTLAGPATAVARGLGWPWFEAFNFSVALAVNVIGCVFLIPRLGTDGAGVAMAISFLIATLCLLALFHRRLGVATGPWLLRLPAPRLLPAALAALGLGLVGDRWAIDSRAEALGVAIVETLAFTAVFVAATWPTGETRALLAHGREWWARWRTGGTIPHGGSPD